MNSFKDDINPANFRYTGSIEVPTQTKSDGIQGAMTWATHEAVVKSQKISPLTSGESPGGKQTVYMDRNSWIIRAHSRAFTTKMRYVVGAVNHYITDVRMYKGLVDFLVLDTEVRDNE